MTHHQMTHRQMTHRQMTHHQTIRRQMTPNGRNGLECPWPNRDSYLLTRQEPG